MNPVKQISVSSLRSRLEQDSGIFMIDVREHEEVIHGMIPGAIHIPMNEIPEHVDELRKQSEIIFICRSGYRSERVCEYLQQLGLESPVNMEGGMLAWNENN